MVILAMQGSFVFSQPASPTSTPPSTGNTVVQEKLRRIEIPNFNLSNTKLTKVIEFLNQGAAFYDQTGIQPKGLRIKADFDPAVSNPVVNINFRNGSLERLLDIATEQVGFEYRVQENTVIISKAKPVVTPATLKPDP